LLGGKNTKTIQYIIQNQPPRANKNMNAMKNEIRISQSRLGGFFGTLISGLMLTVLIDKKYGSDLLGIENLTGAWYWGAFIIFLIIFLVMTKQFLFPKTIFLMNKKGIEIGQGASTYKTQFIPWEHVEKIVKTKVRAIGRYQNNPTTKKREPMMLLGVKLLLSKKYKSCGSYPMAFIQGNSVFVTETLADDDQFIKQLLFFKNGS